MNSFVSQSGAGRHVNVAQHPERTGECQSPYTQVTNAARVMQTILTAGWVTLTQTDLSDRY